MHASRWPNMKRYSMTLQELKKHAGQTSAVLAKAVPGTENFTRLSKELQATKARMLELKSAGVVICFHLLYLCS